MKRVLIVAGEASGDLHGAALMRSMRQLDPAFEFQGIGGSRMEAEGLKALRHVRDMNFMGFFEVIRHLPFIRRTFNEMTLLVDSWKPQLAILIDYPGFNLRLAPVLKQRSITVMYYISPQLWAWHTSRVNQVRRYVDRMVVLFEFEREFYNKHGITVDFVGHPLLDIVKPSESRETFRNSVGAGDNPLVGLLPGSRPQEIDRIFPAMVGAVKILRSKIGPLTAVAGCAPELNPGLLARHIGAEKVAVLQGKTYDIMAHADATAVTSGTATLECGILGTPMVIVYRTSPLTYAIGRLLVDVENIGMINIVAGKRIVPELWQNAVTPTAISEHIASICSDPLLQKTMKQDLGNVLDKLGDTGASMRAATVALSMLDIVV